MSTFFEYLKEAHPDEVDFINSIENQNMINEDEQSDYYFKFIF